MSKRHDSSYLMDILSSSQKIEIIVREKTFAEFEADFQSPLATARLFEIIGEATKNVSEDVKSQYPDVPWKKMAGLRDVLIHRYQDTNERRLFDISKTEIPSLIQNIKKIMAEIQAKED